MTKIQYLSFVFIIGYLCQKEVYCHHQCQICMKTYQKHCQICYDSCQVDPKFISCTLLGPSQNTSLSSSTCLNTCCPQDIETAIFTQQLFNLCVQKDAFVKNNINIGVTLGLILGLAGILSVAGLGYQLGIIKQINILQQAIDSENQRQISSPYENRAPENDINAIANKENSWKQDYRLQGVCPICSNFGINMVVRCGHGYHYGCLANVSEEGKQTCVICGGEDSLASGKIYCSNCKQSYRQFDSKVEKIDNKATEVINNLKCPKCTFPNQQIKL